MTGMTGAIRLQRKSSTAAMSLKHPKKSCYKVRRSVFPQNSQNVKSVVEYLKYKLT